jgi:hypothetical protein
MVKNMVEQLIMDKWIMVKRYTTKQIMVNEP